PRVAAAVLVGRRFRLGGRVGLRLCDGRRGAGRRRRLLAAVATAARAPARLLLRRGGAAVALRLLRLLLGAEIAVRHVDHGARGGPGGLRLLRGGRLLLGGLRLLLGGSRGAAGRGRRLLLPRAAAARAAARLLLRRRARRLRLRTRVRRLGLLLALGHLLLGRLTGPGLRDILVLLPRRRAACARRLLGLGLGRQRLVGDLDRIDELRPGRALADGGDPGLHLLADELRGVRDGDVDAVELRDPGVRVVQPDLAELQLELLADLDRQRRGDLLERPLRQHPEVVEVLALLADEEEAALRRLLQLAQPDARGADDEGRDLRRDLHLERLVAGARGDEPAQAALDVDGGRVLGDDDPVAAAGRALLRHHLARTVGDVLARHLDEAERRDLDDVRLRPVALQLLAERLLHGGTVLRTRHVDEVDDDDAADVAQAQLADDLLHRLEVVLRDRVLEASRRLLRAGSDETPGVHVDHGERLGVVEDEIAARREVDAAAQRRADLLLDAEGLHQGLALLVARDALDHVRRRLLQVADDPLVRAVVVDEQPLEVAGEQVADDAQGQ